MSGDVVCLDRFDGSIRWTRKNILPEISQAYTDPFGVVVAGQSDLNNLEQSPVLLVLDPITGQTTNQVKIQSASDIRWLVGDDQGNTVAATRDSVLCYDIQAQKQRWRLTGATADLGDDPQVANELIYVTDTDTRLQTIDIKTGTIQHLPVLNLEETSATAPRTYAWDGRTLLKTSDGVYIFEYNLERTGQLARAGASDLAISGVAVAEDRTIVLETVANPANANRKQLRLYGIDRTGKKLEHEIQPKTPLPKIDAAQAVDDWIVIDSGNYVIMFYAPVDPNNSTTNP